jgi:type II secretory pathway component HofQ
VDLKAADLPDALQLVASAANRSLVVGADVKGTVTLTMRNVTVEEVLDRFEKDFNLSVKETGNTLVVTNAAPVSAPPAEKASQP